METIENDAVDKIVKLCDDLRFQDFLSYEDFLIGVRNVLIESNKKSIEFAQEWISVEDELPKKYYKPVIVKDKNGNWDKAVLTGLGWCFENEKTRVKKPTHWRPINLK
jgi:hypothetical protein